MKITKRQLRKIIQEESKKLIKEASMEAAYHYADQLIQGVIVELAEEFSEGQLGDAAYDAKMGGEMLIYELLTQSAIASREK